MNDVRDAAHDRLHPVKRARPVASGELAPRTAVWLAATLGVAALAVAVALGPWSVLFMVAFLALQAAYTGGLKHVVLVDVLVISALFVVRAAAGARAVDVRISPWLLICTALLALFLALAKRRAELAQDGRARPVLDGYSLPLVDRLVAATAVATVVAYVLYAVGARESKAMAVTIPFVVYGVTRYLLLLHRRRLGEEPENVLLRDVPLMLAVGAWAATSALVLAFA